MTTSKIGVCVVGCGYMGGIHAECWDRNPRAEIISVVDIDQVRGNRMAGQYHLKNFYGHYQDMIGREDIDVVSVCIPTSLHAEVVIAAAEAGKHVLCEKPIALTLEDADRMIEAASKNQIKLGLGFMRRHSPVLGDLKRFLAEGKFGRPVMYNASDIREIRPKREMHDAKVNGGPVIDMAVHLIDLWSTIFDSSPVSVSAQGLKLAAGRPEIAHIDQVAVDTATMVVKYGSGDIGTFVVTWGLPPKVTPEGHPDQIYGAKGLGEVYYGRNKQELLFMEEGARRQTVSISHLDMYQNQINAFVRWVLDDEVYPARGEDGKSALRVALSAIESMKSEKNILL